VRIRLTELGWKGLLLLFALVLAFHATAYHNLFFLLLAFAGATAVLGAHGAFLATHGVRLVCPQAPIGPANEGLRLPVKVECASGFAGLAVELQLEHTGKRQTLQALPTLMAGARITLLLPGLPRGVHTCRLWLISRYPLGLIEIARPVSDALQVVAHPNPRITAEGSALAAEKGGGSRPASGSRRGLQIAGLRPFVHGDSRAAIHWKASARRGSPVVKELEDEPAIRRDLWLDRSGAQAAFEQRLATVTSQLLQAVANQESVRLRSSDYDSGWLASGKLPLSTWRYLAEVQPLVPEAAHV
jgi:uncharacterized protein (DUF58 family)